MAETAEQELRRLLDLMARLRDPEHGCAWDRAQDFGSIAPYTIEEAYEVADAIARRDLTALPDELGDLLFQVVFHARMAEEQGLFDFAAVAKTITDKMIRRHPHVFDEAGSDNPSWEAHKQAERAARAETGVLAGVPTGLPALSEAHKLTARAARVGFDWPDANAVLEKLDEELAELCEEITEGDVERLSDELGDVLFVIVNLARKLRLDPERCLRGANRKFTRRFNMMERFLADQGKAAGDVTLAEMEALWQAAKAVERGG